MNLLDLAERRYLPDWLIRMGIRRLLNLRERSLRVAQGNSQDERRTAFADLLRDSPLAVETDAANEQHYEVPAGFFEQVLGPHLKYSCCFFSAPDTSLAAAEAQMLQLTCERAEIADGMRVLELGCGWGSLSLWMAEHYPQCAITAVSNSANQRQWIEARAAERGLSNLRVITQDMRTLTLSETFDRVISVEMFEHMRNYELLLKRVAEWLEPDGKAFVHIFCHRHASYLFESEGASNWMGRHFFTGGMMPAIDLLREFRRDLTVQQLWIVNGRHYWRTSEAWLQNLDERQATVLKLLEASCGTATAGVALQRWRIFFMACAESFRYREGTEWFVGHYLLTRSPRRVSSPIRTKQLTRPS